MEDYRVTQTGDEIQEILNQSPIDTASIEGLKEADATLQENIDSEETRAKAAEQANASGISAINGKIPAEASAENKLVDNAALQGGYYTKAAVNNLIQGLGQSDVVVGALPSTGEANTIYRVPGDGEYSDYMWYDGAWQLLATYSANTQGYQYIGIATPITNPGTPTDKVFYFAHEAGTYTNFGSLVVTHGINILKYDGTAWTLEQLVGIDDEPTDGSENLVQSGGVYRDTPKNDNLSIYNAELCVSDENGFSILCLNEGHIISEKFDSADVENLQSKEDVEADFDIADNSGYVVLRLENGHIKTEKFNSAGHWVGKKWYGFGTSITNTSNEGKYAPYLASLSGLLFVNKGHSGGGITSASNESIYNDIFSSDLSDADLITLEIGANDAGAPLGTIYDALSGSSVTDNSTFCGALNLCIRHLQATTSAQIVVISSPKSRYQYQHPENLYDGDETFGPDNHSLTDRDEAIRKVCMLNSCYCILAGSEDGMGYARMNASDDYNVDQVHHTELGGYNFAQSIWSKLKNIPLFYTQIPS